MILLTQDMLRSAYDFLCTTSPFDKWNLPDSEDIQFKIIRDHDRCGYHYHDGEQHIIGMSAKYIGQVSTLLETMAHEMIHVHECHLGIERVGVEHSKAFDKWAELVCEIHGWDLKRF